MSDLSPDDAVDLTAAEYVVGVLDATERATAERRMANDPAFAAEVRWWETHLSPLATELAAVEPSAHVWSAIRDAAVGRPGLMRNLGFWRGATGVSAALAAACLMVVVWPKAPAPVAVAPAPQPALVALVASPDKTQALVVATLDRATGQLVLTPVTMQVPEGHSAQLWLIPPGQAPQSLGLMPGGEVRVSFAQHPELTGAVSGALAISIEPEGGSTTGGPTGPVVAQGGFKT